MMFWKSSAPGAETEAPKPKYVWPKCAPPQQGLYGGALSTGGVQYRQKEVAPGDWEWVVDEEAMASLCKGENDRAELWWALRTRLLTDEEMARVRARGYHLAVGMNESYNADSVKREFNEALHRQALLQMEANPPSAKP